MHLRLFLRQDPDKAKPLLTWDKTHLIRVLDMAVSSDYSLPLLPALSRRGAARPSPQRFPVPIREVDKRFLAFHVFGFSSNVLLGDTSALLSQLVVDEE